MMKFFVISTVLLSPVLCVAQGTVAQDSTPATAIKSPVAPVTKLETLLRKKGLLVIRNSQEAGEIEKTSKSETSDKPRIDYTITVTSETVYELGKENSVVKGLEVSLLDFGDVTSDDPTPKGDVAVSFVDIEEADSLSQAIQSLIDLEAKWRGQDVGSKEATFATRSDLKILLSQANADQSLIVLRNGDCLLFLNVDQLKQLKINIDKGINLLNKP